MPNEIYNLEKPKRIRSVERTLEIVEYLAKHGASTLIELRKETGLSNSTLLRCLATLSDRGWIRRYLAEGRYELTSKISSEFNLASLGDPISELCASHLHTLRDNTGWPSDVAFRGRTGTLTIVETSRVRGILAPKRAVYGISPSFVFSALGRAFLANCTKEELHRQYLALKLIGNSNEREFIRNGELGRTLEKVKKDGYAARDPDYWFEQSEHDPKLNEIAVSIGRHSNLKGSISLVSKINDISLEEFVHKHITQLKDTANQILLKILDFEN